MGIRLWDSMEVYGWGHLPLTQWEQNLGTQSSCSSLPFQEEKEKSLPPTPGPTRICPHPLISCSWIRMGFAEVQGTGG